MALYDGFFDAYEDEGTGEFDRTYDAGEFVQYFGQIIGSGVCVYEDPDSFKVRVSNGSAIVSPGYLFIRGYWLKNDADYTVPLSGSGTQAVVAHLNLTKKMIEIEAQGKAQSYPDSLVLAYVDAAAGTVQDTRPDTSICGIIDAAGSVSNKIIWAENYINSEIKAKLAQAEADINAQSAELDRRIQQVDKAIDRIVVPPIGTIKFSAAQTPESGWLRCDGSFISAASYPALVQALGKISPGIRNFSEIAGGNVARDISNGVIINGRMWVFSNSAKKLYGVPLSGGAVKTVSITGADELSTSAANTYPIFLSIIGSGLFLAQRFSTNTVENMALYANYSFSETSSTLSMGKITPDRTQSFDFCYPTALYVTSNPDGGFAIAAAYITIHDRYATASWENQIAVYKWSSQSYGATLDYVIAQKSSNLTPSSTFAGKSLLGFDRKNSGELVWLSFTSILSNTSDSAGNRVNVLAAKLESILNGTYSLGVEGSNIHSVNVDNAITTMSVVGGNDFMIKYSVSPGSITVKYIANYNSAVTMAYVEKSVSLSGVPSQAKVFTDACLYIPDSGLWLFFIGTGVVFTQDLGSASRYGYLDTRDMLGTVSKFGYIEYDSANDRIVVMGQDATHTVKVGVLKLYGAEDYASDGVFLPTLSKSGIPAYIKAKEAQ